MLQLTPVPPIDRRHVADVLRRSHASARPRLPSASVKAAGAQIQLPVFVLLFVALVYVPLSLLTGWIHAVANLDPGTFVIEAGRGLRRRSFVKVVGSLVTLAAGALVMAAFARRGLSSAERAG